MTELHPTIRNLEMPKSIAALPLTENGYPVLFFADKIDGKYDLRAMDGRKLARCLKEKLCWLCGQPLRHTFAFVIGPMCAVTRTTTEPPSHLECARYAVKACPFLARPKAHRREVGIPENVTVAGIGLKRNPGVATLWITNSYKIQGKPRTTAELLLTVGKPTKVEWWCEGRQATYSEVAESIESGAPELFKICEQDRNPEESRTALVQFFAKIMPLIHDLPGREERKPEHYGYNEAIMIAVRSDELAWFAMHPNEHQYIRPARKGEFPPEITPQPTHVKVTWMEDRNARMREFGYVSGGVWKDAIATKDELSLG